LVTTSDPRAAEKGQVHPGRDPLYPGKADLEQAVATCLSSLFETLGTVRTTP